MRRWSLLIALALACEKASAPPVEPPPEPPPGPDQQTGEVVLYVGADDRGTRSLFQLSPGGQPRSVDLGNPEAYVLSAAASANGRAVAAMVGAKAGFGLWRAIAGEPQPLIPWSTSQTLRAISDDGQVVVVDVGTDLAVVRLAGGKPAPVAIDVAAQGVLSYGVALSRDGSKLAFSTMNPRCKGDIRAMQTCPVHLWGVDLGKPALEVRPIAAHAGAVSYDPWFVDAAGTELTFMSTHRDRGADCKKSVNHCAYTVERVGFAGGASRVVATGAILGRVGTTGALSYRVRGADSSGRRSWMGQSLLVVQGDQPPVTLVRGNVSHRYHAWGPRDRQLAVYIERDGSQFIDVVTIDGQRLPGAYAANAILTGWSSVPLPEGARSPRLPRVTTDLRAAVAAANAAAGTRTVAVVDPDELAWSQLASRPRRLSRTDLAGLGADILVVGPRAAYCTARASGFGAQSTHGGLVVFGKALAATIDPAPRAAAGETPQFSFRAGAATIELIGHQLPDRARAGQRFRARLDWHLVKPPAPGWKVFVHFDGAGTRFQADHELGLCGAAGLPPDSVVSDSFEVTVEPAPPGDYTVWIGWYRAADRAVASGPSKWIASGRVKIGTLRVE